jgi:hypothetical protein
MALESCGVSRSDIMKTAKTLNWLLVVLGIWEILAPFIVGYSGSSSGALWDAIILGAAWVVLGYWATRATNSNSDSTVKALGWVNAVLGLWVIVAPFIIGYSATSGALWNDIIVGIVVTVLAGWSALAIPKK